MAITHKYTLLCDDVRQENNGKFLILGLYTPDITVPAVPFALPSLCFFTMLEASEAVENLSFDFKLKLQDAIIAGGSGKLQVKRPGMSAIPFKLGGVQLSAGKYTFTLDLGTGDAITHEFSVVLRVQNLPSVTPKGGVH